MPKEPLPVFGRYLLFQLPGMAVASIVLAGLVEFWELPIATAVVLFAFWVAKDLALYPFVKVAYGSGGAHVNGPDTLIGRVGCAQEDLDPEGYVKIGPELWRARRKAASGTIPKGASVRVVRMRDLTVIVEAAGDETSDTPS